MTNTITLDTANVGTFLGPIASRYAYTPELRKAVDRCFQGAQRSTNRWFVLEGDIVRAAQSTESGARQYMTDQTVLVDCSALIIPQELAREGWHVVELHRGDALKFPQPKRCSHCGQPLNKTPIRWCVECKRPLGLHDKYVIVRGRGFKHRDCKRPGDYPK